MSSSNDNQTQLAREAAKQIVDNIAYLEDQAAQAPKHTIDEVAAIILRKLNGSEPLKLTNPNGAFIDEVREQVLIPGPCGAAGHFRFHLNGNNCLLCQTAAVDELEGYRRGVEDAAKIADERVEFWDKGKSNMFGILLITEAEQCAAAIRALLTAEQGVSGRDATYNAELAQERLETAVRIALDGLRDRCGRDALAWFQSEYREAAAKVKDADEQTVFALRKEMPTLTGTNHSAVASAGKE